MGTLELPCEETHVYQVDDNGGGYRKSCGKTYPGLPFDVGPTSNETSFLMVSVFQAIIKR
jgi:hypothetical protein